MRRCRIRALCLSAAFFLCALIFSVPAYAEQATVTGDKVNVREGPGADRPVTGSLKYGAAVDIIDRSNPDWFLVSWDGGSGYVFSLYLHTDSPDAQESEAEHLIPQAPAAGYITGMHVSLRGGPGTGYPILGTYSNGKALTITGSFGPWKAVTVEGKEGYVYESYVREGLYESAVAAARAAGAEPGKDIAAYALSFVGTPYTWGGNSPATGFDCAGFVQYIFSQYGYTTSRIANDIRRDGEPVEPEELQPGDVLCFYSGSQYVGHVGIYVGDGTFVHAANSISGVVTTSLTSGYYATRGYEIRRIV